MNLSLKANRPDFLTKNRKCMRNARLRGAESYTSTTEYKEQIILFMERIISKKLPKRAF